MKPEKPPNARELEAVLGPAREAFAALARPDARTRAEWRRYSKTSPWVLKVCAGTRTLYYLQPDEAAVNVTVVLGARAVAAALAGRVPKALHASIRAAKPYVEGRPVRVTVRGMADVPLVEQLVSVKLDP